MTVYTWFFIFNKAEFLALNLTSKTYTLILGDIGQKEIMATKGVAVGILYNDIFLSLELNDKNPFEFEGHAIYIDENDDVFLGVHLNEN